MWTPTTRKQHSRNTNRYQSDLTDEEWRVIEPHLPAASSTGRPRSWPMREISRSATALGCRAGALSGKRMPNCVQRTFAIIC